jgi:hypothetical protein
MSALARADAPDFGMSWCCLDCRPVECARFRETVKGAGTLDDAIANAPASARGRQRRGGHLGR